MRSFLIVIPLLLMCATLSACKKRGVPMPLPPGVSAKVNTLVPGTVITSAGTWTHVAGNTWRLLTTTLPGSQVSWQYELSDGGSGSSSLSSGIPLASPSAPWFIYVESPDRLWTFNGSGELFLVRWRSDGNYHTEAISDGKLRGPASTEVPSGLIPNLPADLQKLFPTELEQPRPGI